LTPGRSEPDDDEDESDREGGDAHGGTAPIIATAVPAFKAARAGPEAAVKSRLEVCVPGFS
jgi:hypothetical protein